MAKCTTLCDKVCQWLATGQWFSLGTSVSSTNKTDRHDIAQNIVGSGVIHHQTKKQPTEQNICRLLMVEEKKNQNAFRRCVSCICKLGQYMAFLAFFILFSD